MLCALREGGKGSRAGYVCTLSRARMGAGMGGTAMWMVWRSGRDDARVLSHSQVSQALSRIISAASRVGGGSPAEGLPQSSRQTKEFRDQHAIIVQPFHDIPIITYTTCDSILHTEFHANFATDATLCLRTSATASSDIAPSRKTTQFAHVDPAAA